MFELGVAVVGTSTCVATASWYLWRGLLSYLFLPSQIVYALRQSDLEATRQEFLKRCMHAQRVSIPIKNGVVLDGVEFNNLSSVKYSGSADAEQKYFVHFNANGVCYEDKLESLLKLQQELAQRGWFCKVLCINYRGVGHSSGKTVRAADLVEDVGGVLKWIKGERGVSWENISCHGHSIGGAAVVLACAALWQAEPLEKRDDAEAPDSIHISVNHVPETHPFVLADRTFSSLGKVVEDKLGSAFDMGPVGAILFANISIASFTLTRFGIGFIAPIVYGFGGLTALVTSIAVGRILTNYVGKWWPFFGYVSGLKSPKMREYASMAVRVGRCAFVAGIVAFGSVFIGPAWEITLLLTLAGFYLGRKGYLNQLSLRLVDLIGWKMDPGRDWHVLANERKVATCHPQDAMIPTHVSLSQECKEGVITLSSRYGDPHMYDLFSPIVDRNQVLEALSPFFT
mmetsp:Transcript_17880/g.28992  ORF Transcript_17880/g.28992 Transcript_17880/m.28992 type:complete len:456 (+) Transcript_17880:1834-3201(+)